MILDGSDKSDSKTTQTVRSEGSQADRQSPPPYSPSSASTRLGDQKPLPTPPHASSAGPASLPQGLPPPCNYLIQRRSNDSIKGAWHVDPALPIPDSLLAFIEDFDGKWNEADQKARKERKKLEKKGKRRSDNIAASPNAIRPNLMLKSNNGSIDAKVHVAPSDGQPRIGLIVAEGSNGSISLDIKTYPSLPLRIFALSDNASVRVKVPDTFEGAIIASSKHGSIKISDPIKSRMTTFSGISDTTRGFIGDWQAAGFGSSPASSTPSPNDDPPLPSTLSDSFLSWSGPLIHISSQNGSVHLSYSDEPRNEEDGGGFSNAFRGFMSGLFGTGGETRGRPTAGRGGGPPESGRFPWGDGEPWGSDKHSWGNGAPWVPPMSPPGPFGRGDAPFARGGGPFGRGCAHRRGGSGGYSSGCSRRNGPEEGASHDYGEQELNWDNVERDASWFPMDKKDPSGA